ncbi:hypothetical protein DGWBC_0293 [Dehalogenimonas sp. WBC-2]|nr:hypothetical protein DGWBC_0293 [Dehalogenimonas sp. WBC-2]
MWYWNNMHDWGFGGGLFMFILWIAVIALIVWGVVTLTKRGDTGVGTTSSRRDPLDIAKERYARGEITKDQFDAIKKDLIG